MFKKVAGLLLLSFFSCEASACCCKILTKGGKNKVMAQIGTTGATREKSSSEIRLTNRKLFAKERGISFIAPLSRVALRKRSKESLKSFQRFLQNYRKLSNDYWGRFRKNKHDFFGGDEIVSLTIEILKREKNKPKIYAIRDFLKWCEKQEGFHKSLISEDQLFYAHLFASFHAMDRDPCFSQALIIIGSPKRKSQELSFMRI